MALKEGEPRKHWGRCPETSTKVGTVCLLVTWPEKNQPLWHWPEPKEITRSRSIDMEETGGPRSWGTHLVLDVAHKRPSQAQGPTCTCSYTRTFNIYILQTDTYIHIYINYHTLPHRHIHPSSHKVTCLVSHKEQDTKLSRNPQPTRHHLCHSWLV